MMESTLKFLFLSPMIILGSTSVASPFIWLIEKRFKVKYLTGIISSIALILVLYALLRIFTVIDQSTGKHLEIYLAQPPLGVSLYIDYLSIFFSAIFAFVGLFASVYSTKYVEKFGSIGFYYSLLDLTILGMIGVTFAGDFFDLYVFWELMSVSTYALVAFHKERMEAIEAAFKYLVIASFGSILMLFSISLIYGLTGTLNVRIAAHLLAGYPDVPIKFLIFCFLIAGFGVKAGAFPFWTWLPDAHPAAPSPISAMLSGVIVKTGIYGFIRFLPLLFPPIHLNYGLIIVLVSVSTMIVGNTLALLQRDVKRLLAYSTVTHIGYILIGIASAYYSQSINGLSSSIFHFLNHALAKSLAFLSTGSILYVVGTRDLEALKGIGKKMPISSLCLAVSLFSLGGIPALNGFMSKWYLFESAVESGLWYLALIGVLNSAFSTIYYLWIFQRMFLFDPSPQISRAKEAPLTMVIPTIVLSALCFVIGVYPQPLMKLAQESINYFYTLFLNQL